MWLKNVCSKAKQLEEEEEFSPVPILGRKYPSRSMEFPVRKQTLDGKQSDIFKVVCLSVCF